MRVLVTVNDATGHVLPLLPLIGALAGSGHEVLVASPGPVAGRLVTVPGVEVTEVVARPTPPVTPDSPAHDQHAARLEWAVERSWPNDARGWADELLALAQEWRPELAVVEPVEHAGRAVAAALGLPVIEHGWGFSLPAGSDLAATDGLQDLYARLGAVARPPVLRADTSPALLQAADIAPEVERFRYVPWSPVAEVLPPPAPGTPRVLVTLGTYENPHAAERIRGAVHVIAKLGVEVVVALGHVDRGSAAGWPAGVLVAQWIDFADEVTRCDLVVHHAGAGSSLTTVLSGRPAVCLPQMGDQFRNAGLLVAAGAAARLDPPEVDGPALAAAVTAALADTSMTAAASRLASANAALPPPAALVERLASLLS